MRKEITHLETFFVTINLKSYSALSRILQVWSCISVGSIEKITPVFRPFLYDFKSEFQNITHGHTVPAIFKLRLDFTLKTFTFETKII